MNELKKIALKLLLLGLVLVVLNYIYRLSFWKGDQAKYSDFVQKIWDAKDADILYLGDCSDVYFGENPINKKGISDLLDSLLPKNKVAGISDIGFHAGIYYSILKQIPSDSKVSTVIVTMNLRSFSARIIHSDFDNPNKQKLVLLNTDYPPLLNRCLLSFRIPYLINYRTFTHDELEKMIQRDWKTDNLEIQPPFPYKTLYEWSTAFERGEYIKFDESWTIERKKVALSHIQNYAFKIDTLKNPRIKDFDKIVELAEIRKWNLIFNILPENINETKELIGNDLILLINYNRKLLHRRYSTKGVAIIDNIDAVEGEQFIEELPNSHFHYKGRIVVAKSIVKILYSDQNL